MLSCTIWTHCRHVWSFVDIIAFTVFKEVWLSLYTLYIFLWHSWFTVTTSAKCFAFATNSFSLSWWMMTKVNSLNLLFSSQFILIAIIVTSSLLSLSFKKTFCFDVNMLKLYYFIDIFLFATITIFDDSDQKVAV